MSEDQIFPEDYYLSFPYLRLTNKRFLILDNNSILNVVIKKGQSYVTLVGYISDIKKMDVFMISSKYGSKLYAGFVPREGKKQIFLVGPMKLRYRKEDWQRILDFFRSTGFIPHKNPAPEKFHTKFYPIHPDEHMWFAPNDRIFQLYEDPTFFEELKTVRPGFWAPFLTVFASIGIIVGIVLAIVLWEDIWIGIIIYFAISGLFLLYGILKLIKFAKRRKEFGKKYGIEYYFK